MHRLSLAICLAIQGSLGCLVGLAQSDERLVSLLANAPPHLNRLIDRGQVRLEIDDEKLAKAKRAAQTEFTFAIEYSMRYSTEKPNGLNGSTLISVHYPKREMTLSHVVTLSTEFFERNDGWESPLLRHEFDHVAVTTDPRVMKLSEAVMFDPFTFTLESATSAAAIEKATHQQCENAFEQRKAALISLLNDAYGDLDKRSQHGLQPIEDRQDFFASLYQEEWLMEKQFAWIKPCKKLFKSSGYRKLGDHYVLLDQP